jgi:hypothetical protein
LTRMSSRSCSDLMQVTSALTSAGSRWSTRSATPASVRSRRIVCLQQGV